VHLCMYVDLFTGLFVHLCMYVDLFTGLFVHLCMYVDVFTGLFVHTQVSLCIDLFAGSHRSLCA